MNGKGDLRELETTIKLNHQERCLQIMTHLIIGRLNIDIHVNIDVLPESNRIYHRSQLCIIINAIPHYPYNRQREQTYLAKTQQLEDETCYLSEVGGKSDQATHTNPNTKRAFLWKPNRAVQLMQSVSTIIIVTTYTPPTTIDSWQL